MTERTGAAGRHVPVLRDRIVELLAPALSRPLPDGERPVYVDGTLGMGGHAEAVLTACPEARLVGIDRDTEAIRLAAERLAPFGDRVTLVHARYDEIGEVLADVLADRAADRPDDRAAAGATPGVQAILLDLGVSSLQLDELDRGFAYRVDAPLDMRMDATTGPTAADVLNTYDAAELTRVLRTYGEERFAARIAKAVVRERERAPFTTSARLVELLRDAIPAASQRTGGHPGKRTFQALRIEVNAELASLEVAVPAAVDALAVGGRLAVLSYHSLEDRLVKQALAAGATSTAPPGLPVELPEHRPFLRLVTRGGEEPTEAEVAENSRAASARLRVAERTRPSGPLAERHPAGPRRPDRPHRAPSANRTPAASRRTSSTHPKGTR
ncbi:16S rRNA (cytosine(1402)-N(4))-methyltransferase RsmH [Arsenicicoccus piscis]|uniref:Ribosomal RNA small subunit methyltransferase H n=1 Tax=Arsenicicoccus piscis TaxID=673954 RepID=A0ABQ6HKF3_9MICO|nr:16S rRNA (cytosine(1402)-N(4))-methyltransferase RsmH [Arsenicicoccus piscis]MCH8627113.1 16S rRNA (cytosine(1402)-N(4))-methyltransferase RsmH [Arsenicicoccus piscis]GMA18936.1 ribosomal RNA small subunit methyltransferase H [Arsenicicoccus piscis]